jgi:hypothetical protein
MRIEEFGNGENCECTERVCPFRTFAGKSFWSFCRSLKYRLTKHTQEAMHKYMNPVKEQISKLNASLETNHFTGLIGYRSLTKRVSDAF